MRLTTLLCSFALLAFSFTAPASASKQRAYSVRPGGVVYIDTLDWSDGLGSGTGGTIDTLIGTSARDTSETFQLANLKYLGAMFVYNNIQGTAGGEYTFACSLEVSIDGSNWYRPVASAVFSTASSTDPAENHIMVLYDNTRSDSVLTGANTRTSGSAMHVIGSARLGRIISKQVAGAADTTFNRVILSKEYLP